MGPPVVNRASPLGADKTRNSGRATEFCNHFINGRELFHAHKLAHFIFYGKRIFP
jgi:hypothetical protein